MDVYTHLVCNRCACAMTAVVLDRAFVHAPGDNAVAASNRSDNSFNIATSASSSSPSCIPSNKLLALVLETEETDIRRSFAAEFLARRLSRMFLRVCKMVLPPSVWSLYVPII